jgi:hypothetical protein
LKSGTRLTCPTATDDSANGTRGCTAFRRSGVGVSEAPRETFAASEAFAIASGSSAGLAPASPSWERNIGRTTFPADLIEASSFESELRRSAAAPKREPKAFPWSTRRWAATSSLYLLSSDCISDRRRFCSGSEYTMSSAITLGLAAESLSRRAAMRVRGHGQRPTEEIEASSMATKAISGAGSRVCLSFER